MRYSVLMFAVAMAASTGCDDTSTSAKPLPDLSVITHDMAQAPLPDLAVGTATACGALYDCVFNQGMSVATCTAGAPTASAAAFTTLTSCQTSACTAQCAVDGGVNSLTCQNCLNNTIVGPNSDLVDNNNMPIPCVPTTAAECGMCTMQLDSCLVQCITDADCQGFVNPLTCQNGSCM